MEQGRDNTEVSDPSDDDDQELNIVRKPRKQQSPRTPPKKKQQQETINAAPVINDALHWFERHHEENVTEDELTSFVAQYCPMVQERFGLRERVGSSYEKYALLQGDSYPTKRNRLRTFLLALPESILFRILPQHAGQIEASRAGYQGAYASALANLLVRMAMLGEVTVRQRVGLIDHVLAFLDLRGSSPAGGAQIQIYSQMPDQQLFERIQSLGDTGLHLAADGNLIHDLRAAYDPATHHLQPETLAPLVQTLTRVCQVLGEHMWLGLCDVNLFLHGRSLVQYDKSNGTGDLQYITASHANRFILGRSDKFPAEYWSLCLAKHHGRWVRSVRVSCDWLARFVLEKRAQRQTSPWFEPPGPRAAYWPTSTSHSSLMTACDAPVVSLIAQETGANLLEWYSEHMGNRWQWLDWLAWKAIMAFGARNMDIVAMQPNLASTPPSAADQPLGGQHIYMTNLLILCGLYTANQEVITDRQSGTLTLYHGRRPVLRMWFLILHIVFEFVDPAVQTIWHDHVITANPLLSEAVHIQTPVGGPRHPPGLAEWQLPPHLGYVALHQFLRQFWQDRTMDLAVTMTKHAVGFHSYQTEAEVRAFTLHADTVNEHQPNPVVFSGCFIPVPGELGTFDIASAFDVVTCIRGQDVWDASHRPGGKWNQFIQQNQDHPSTDPEVQRAMGMYGNLVPQPELGLEDSLLMSVMIDLHGHAITRLPTIPQARLTVECTDEMSTLTRLTQTKRPMRASQWLRIARLPFLLEDSMDELIQTGQLENIGV